MLYPGCYNQGKLKTVCLLSFFFFSLPVSHYLMFTYPEHGLLVHLPGRPVRPVGGKAAPRSHLTEYDRSVPQQQGHRPPQGENTREYTRIHENTREYTRIHENTREYTRIHENTRDSGEIGGMFRYND